MLKFSIKLIFISLILIMFLIIQKVYCCNLTLSNNEGLLGKTREITIPITLTNLPSEEPCAIQFDINFDPQALLINDVILETAYQQLEKQISFNTVKGNLFRVLIYGVNQNIISQGNIANLKIKFAPLAPVGSSPLILETFYICDSSGSLIATTVTNASIAIKAPDVCSDLTNLEVYPNPFKPYSGHGRVYFMNLTQDINIKIFSISGELVKVINQQTNGMAEWLAENDSGRKVASGTYIYYITNSAGEKRKGKIVIVR